MALSNEQYQSIVKSYEKIQIRNRHLMQERRERVLSCLPAYAALEQESGSFYTSCGKRLLDGDNNALTDLHNYAASLTSKKEALLVSGGFPKDYLDPVYDCPICKDTGYETEKETGIRKKCRCFRQKEIDLLYEQSNIRKTIDEENFSTLSFAYYTGEDLKRFKEAVRICLDFVQNFDDTFQNLFFYGTVGTGKSFLSGCIAKELLQKGKSVIYFSSVGLFDTLARYSFDTKSKESLYNFYKDLYNCDLVIVDDLGTEIQNTFVVSQFFNCLNERILRRKPTVISTNLSLEELQERYSDRIFSRVISQFTLCKLTGPDIRLCKKRMGKQAQ